MRDVTQRPDALVREAKVVAGFFFRCEPHAPQRVLRLIDRHTKPIVRIDGGAIGVARSVRDPRAVAGTQHRFERGHKTARRHQHFHVFPALHVHVRLAIRDHEQRPALQLVMNADAEPLGGPEILARVAQTRLFGRNGPRHFEAVDQVRHLARQGLEDVGIRKRHCCPLSRSQAANPCRGARNRPDETPSDEQERDRHDPRDLHEHVHQHVTPHP